jgi:hypothetical protein
MHPEFAVQVTVIVAASVPLLVPELLPVPPLELPLEPPPLELLLPLLFGLELLHPKRATAATDATTPTACTIFIVFFPVNPEVRTDTRPSP